MESRAEAERLLGLAEKLLVSRDLEGAREFALLAQETEPLLDGSDQILAIADVLLAAERRINNHHDWYAILQAEPRSGEIDVIKKRYRRLALLLHPDKNKFSLGDQAFKLVADAWAVLSNPAKKTLYDDELRLFTRIELGNTRGKQPARRGRPPSAAKARQRAAAPEEKVAGAHRRKLSTFWTTCPYCYNLFEYPQVYEGCSLRCQNCRKAFHAAEVPSLPPIVPGKDAYYCSWAFFPLGFVAETPEANGAPPAQASPNPTPNDDSAAAAKGETAARKEPVIEVPDESPEKETTPFSTQRKRGRPRRNV